MRGTSHSCLSADSLLRTIDAPTAPSKGAPRSTAQPNLASSARTSKRPTASLVPWAASAKSATGPPPHSHGPGMREVSLRRWFGNQSGACRVAWQVVRESYRGAVWQSARAMSSADADAGMAGIRLANVTHTAACPFVDIALGAAAAAVSTPPVHPPASRPSQASPRRCS